MAVGKLRYWLWMILALCVLGGAFYLWQFARHWAPSRDEFPLQGIVVDADNGDPVWSTLSATGVDFAYLTATGGGQSRDSSFARNLDAVRRTGMRFGAIHHYDLCSRATEQATLFITTVPRNENALPPAIQLDFAEGCDERPGRALILSELVTLLAQIEVHSGRPAILMIDRKFEEHYRISDSVDRNVWATGNWLVPDYTARPWVMWTANDMRHMDGLDGPVRWAVVRN